MKVLKQNGKEHGWNTFTMVERIYGWNNMVESVERTWLDGVSGTTSSDHIGTRVLLALTSTSMAAHTLSGTRWE